MKFRCAAAMAALALSSLGCQAVKPTNNVTDNQVLQVSHQTSHLPQRGVRPALRPIGFACGGDCSGCGEVCDSCGPTCDACGPACGGCDGYGCCSEGNPRINGIVGAVLDCKPHDGVYDFQPGPPVGQTAYPYYTVRGPRDFLTQNPRSIGPTGGYGCR